MRRGRVRVWHVVALIVALGVLVEIPLVAYILTRGDDTSFDIETSGNTL